MQLACTARLLGLDDGQERLEVHQRVDFADLCPRRNLAQAKYRVSLLRFLLGGPAPERT